MLWIPCNDRHSCEWSFLSEQNKIYALKIYIFICLQLKIIYWRGYFEKIDSQDNVLAWNILKKLTRFQSGQLFRANTIMTFYQLLTISDHPVTTHPIVSPKNTNCWKCGVFVFVEMYVVQENVFAIAEIYSVE